MLILSIGYSVKPWLICQRFFDQFYYSSLDLQLRMIESIHAESGTPIFLVRFFHNKLVGSLLDGFRSYTLYFDFRFLTSLIGVTGLLFALVGVYHLLSEKKTKRSYVFLALIIIYPFFSIFFRSFIPYQMWFGGFIILLSSLSVYGLCKVRLHAYMLSILVITLILTI